jgi:hypothetical protein
LRVEAARGHRAYAAPETAWVSRPSTS